MSRAYNSSAIEVLSGLDPVKRRPGMYTDVTRPNHLAQEVIDNSVDEALSGYAKEVTVTLYQDGSLSVQDDGRGMPVDLHPEEGISGVEVILTKLHAGGKFNQDHYRFAGGLHGVGVSVVNALSSRVEVEIKRNGKIYTIAFEHGFMVEPLKETGTVGQRNTGTTVHFWPDAQYFDSPKFSLQKLHHILRAKAILCPGLVIHFKKEGEKEVLTWCYENGLKDYLFQQVSEWPHLPQELFLGHYEVDQGAIDWAITWMPEGGELTSESYVNLIPTILGGTHVNGFRSGLLEAMREFCELHSLCPRALKLAPEDLWDRASYVLSVKWLEPQFAGQTKERLSSRECAGFVESVVKDAFSIWLNHHLEEGKILADFMINRAQERTRESKKVVRKKVVQGPQLPGKLTDCASHELDRSELFLVEGDSAGGSAKQARDRDFQAIMPLRGKILNAWEVPPEEVLASQEVHDIAVAIGVDPGSSDISELRYGKICILADADSDGAHIATLLCALFLRHFKPLVQGGFIFVAMPPLYRIDVGKTVRYALDASEKDKILKELSKQDTGKISVLRFKGLGEMNPSQLRETTMRPETRRLLQLTLEEPDLTESIMDMMLGKKRANDRKDWLESSGNLAKVRVDE